MHVAKSVRCLSKRAPSTLAVGSLPHTPKAEPSLRTEPRNLKDALSEFGHELVMRASDQCRVLPHILHLIGKGGEHVVFEDLRFPNYVLKVDFIESLPVLYAQAKGEDAVTKAVDELRQKAQKHHERLKKLQAYFPSGCVPLETVAVKEIPMDESVVVSLMRDRNLDIPHHLVVPKTMPVLCTIQHKLDLPKKGMVDIYSSYAELNRTILPEYYADGHRLLASVEAIGPEETEAREKIIVYIYPSLKPVIDRMRTDAELRRQVGDYVRQAMRYAVDTDEIIDMAGGGNVVFFMADGYGNPLPNDEAAQGRWQPFLMDALSPPELNLELVRKTALLLKHEQEPDVRTKANTLNAINFIRFANALAMSAGISDRLEVQGMTEVSPEAWRTGLLIEKYMDVYTPKKEDKR